ncbi:MAG TPA: CvpA family protein [Rhizomicrobium sp.]|jgi:membrane protein required for colicin V production|nr:CvpA family protein [Rhizomicrobium sp.]
MDLHFSFVDLLVAVIVLASAVFAIYRGFVRETLSIFAWAAAAFATLYFGPSAAAALRDRISPAALGMAVGYIGVFLVVLIPLSFISFRFAESVHRSPVGAVDRSLGFAFGVVRGLAIIGFAYILFTSVMQTHDQPKWLTEARSFPLMQNCAQVLLSLVPDRDMAATQRTRDVLAPATNVPQPTPNPRDTAKNSSKRNQKTYGARDRRALDRLIQSTGGSGQP